ncbi:MAG: hypothetical protein JO354_10910 [Verrucomicrobia bacterium]|nr:hypothetical protein [Verrucomicrobiota bacterium]
MKNAALTPATAMLVLGLIGGFVVGFSVAGWRHSSGSGSRGTESHHSDNISSTAAASKRASHSLDPDAPQVMLGNITTVPFQELYSLLSTLPPEKLAALASQLDRLPGSKESDGRIATFFKAWAQLDPMAALRSALTFHASEAKTTAIGTIVESADLAQAAALAKAIKDLPAGAINREQQNNFLASAVSKWAQLAPTDAAKFFDETQSGSMRFRWVASNIAQSWAAQDPAAALAWAQQHGESDGFAGAIMGAVMGWWTKDHDAAEAYVLSHLEENRGLSTSLVSYIYQRDPERAKTWVSELPNLEMRRLANNMLTTQMAFNDPKGASEWAATLPADVRQQSLGAAVTYWASSDLTAAGEWVNSLSGAPRDEAATAYTYTLLRKDPASAAAWAVTINDPVARNSALQTVALQWLHKDAQQAAAWIQSTALPDDQKQRLLALAPKQ